MQTRLLLIAATNELEVPANADFVMEGYVDPTEPLRLSACGHAQAGFRRPWPPLIKMDAAVKAKTG